MDPSGGFVVVWRGRDYFVRARWFDARGGPLGSERQMSSPNALNFPAVAADRKASLVAWSVPPDEVDGHMFKLDGQPIGAEFFVGHHFQNGAFPAPAAVPGAGFVVVWMEWQQVSNRYVRGRRFDRAGDSVGPEFTVNQYTVGVWPSPSVAVSPNGDFIVVWERRSSIDITGFIWGRRMTASGTPLGPDFLVSETSSATRHDPNVATDDQGNFVVTWMEFTAALGGRAKARRFDASGSGLGSEFVVNAFPRPLSYHPVVAGDAAGNFTVVWEQNDGYSSYDVLGRRFTATGAPRGAVFKVNTYSAGLQREPAIAGDGHGNFIVVWNSTHMPDGLRRAFGRRYGGLVPAAMAVSAGGNDVLELGESFQLMPAWRNISGVAQTFQGRSSGVTSPPGVSMSLSAEATYGPIADNESGTCGTCFTGSLTGQRPAGHLDARFVETVVPDTLGQVQRWKLHIGDSFTDVGRTSPFYRFVETLLHRAVTGGCGGTAYCPTDSVTREQMAVFVLTALEGADYAPPSCTMSVFADVPPSSPFCRWIEELARRGVTGGCGGGNYCPAAPVSREQMAVFVLRTLDPPLNPPVCAPPNLFNDVPETSVFCPWIEELARRGIVAGCGGGNYCPAAPVTREQMAVFLTGTFGLTLYGP